jgi:DNA-directed RNA polymerase specialized sigma24 family protein
VPERDDNAVSTAAERSSLVPPPYRSLASFIAAIRIGEPRALRQLFIYAAPLLRDQARTMGVPADEADELVMTLLDDFVLHVQDTDAVPTQLARYLVGALRNRVRSRYRQATRRRAHDERAYGEHGQSGQRVVAECHSQHGLRAAEPTDVDPAEAHMQSAIEKLAAKSALALTTVEASLMVGLSRHIPLRELAAQAGISYGAARVRVHRLRERMVKLAIQHLATLQADERREIERFLRRAGVYLGPEDRMAPPAPVDRRKRGADHSDEGGVE